MAESNKELEGNQRSKKFLWFGYGNYGSHPNLQIGGGYIRDPGVFEKLFKDSKTDRSPMAYFMYAAAALIGLTAIGALIAWGISLIWR